jgi:hypothetical protein
MKNYTHIFPKLFSCNYNIELQEDRYSFMEQQPLKKEVVLTKELSKEIQIIQDSKKETLFTLYFFEHNPPLLRSIKNVLVNCTEIDGTLQIRANKIQSFLSFWREESQRTGSQNLSYLSCLSLVYFFSKQLLYLIEKESHCFYKIQLENILMVDKKCLYISNSHLKKKEGESLLLYSMIDKTTGFLSPEVQKIQKIPTEIHYKSIFYSLASLVVYVFSFTKIEKPTKNMFIEQEQREKLLVSIQGTKLYFLLERCFYKNAQDRVLLYL